jgi:asparagine synthase (glutamine-hydrolysing)
MSGIVGILHFDGKPVERQEIAAITAAMVRRGPDGINHWLDRNVGLGHCMLRTTPESLKEAQPLANEDQSLVLVMDGRVDNWIELRRELLAHGANLRDPSDAELTLRAYEVWGEDCPNRIIGEFAFFVWDARRRRLFGARDPAGARHFYYHNDRDWFAFASEIKGLLALGRIEPTLNESRMFDYLSVSFIDRGDQVQTFYRGIVRLPAGHAMTVEADQVKTWRYWDPSNIAPARFRSLDECAEAFREQLEVAIKSRLRSIGPVGAELSGGLDSSSIVGLICNPRRPEVNESLLTFSLVRSDRDKCRDWQSLKHMIVNPLISAAVISSDIPVETCRAFYESVIAADEPFEAFALPQSVVYSAALESGCRVLLEGSAGDLLFYGYPRSINVVLKDWQLRLLPPLLSAAWRHRRPEAPRELARGLATRVAPTWLRDGYRRFRAESSARSTNQIILNRGVVDKFSKIILRDSYLLGTRSLTTDQASHARLLMDTNISPFHELCGQMALSSGLEPRSPFSDRRMLEFAIKMPLQMKLCAPWYKYGLRRSMVGILPDEVLWRRAIGGNPGWAFYKRLIEAGEKSGYSLPTAVPLAPGLDRWVDSDVLMARARNTNYTARSSVLPIVFLSAWLRKKGLAVP